ncbi:MAG: L,D-transpeptidase family protein [Lachnospiraceae bacterium]|nr:L,D-transpeptidase family protein [Lachnospiraceae bacterium]
MMKTLWTRLLIVLAVLTVTVAVGCAALTRYYQTGFGVNTWVNGIYATGKSVQEIKNVLMEQTEVPRSITVISYDRVGQGAKPQTHTLLLSEIGFVVDYDTALQNCYSEQRNVSWLDSLKTPLVYNLTPDKRFDEELLKQWWQQNMPDMQVEAEYRITYSVEAGYGLIDNNSHRLDEEKAFAMVREAILAAQETTVDLIEAGCYYDVPLTEEQENQKFLWEKLKLYQTNGPIYDFTDEKRELDAGEMAAFLQKDPDTQMPLENADGAFLIDEKLLTTWLKTLAEKYDTYQKEWEFQTTNGKTVTVKGVTYGTTMNQKQELIWLKQYFKALAALQTMDGESIVDENSSGRIRTAEYTRDAFTHSGTSLGNTYIEVDMGLQKLYYYVDGEIKLESDTVTGNMRRKYSTPEGVNYVYNKQKNRLLRGQGYTQPVKFWMPVKGAVGIHDAEWRDEFGGDIYLTNGSHGCVNIPLDKAEALYDMVEVGTPVIMFYGEDNN